jgi:ribonuclease-3
MQEALGHRFQDPALLAAILGSLQQPLTPERAVTRQRLQFLGDAAWNFAVAVAAIQSWPQATAGDLTRLRASLCSTHGLAQLAREVGLSSVEGAVSSDRVLAETPLAGTRGAEGQAARGLSDRVLAETFEAVLGAIVQDGGYDAIQALAHRVISRQGAAKIPPPVDPKSALQMLAQARYGTLPTYQLLDRRGPPHQPIFRVSVSLRGQDVDIREEALGNTIQGAEQEAARLALDRLAVGSSS